MKVLTGIKPTGDLHLGNYIGAIKQVEELSINNEVYLFVADLHALNGGIKPNDLIEYTEQLLAALYSFFKDNQNVKIYLQSQISATFELETILSNYTAKGLLNRAHAYKAKVDQNQLTNKEQDFEVNMGLFNYPLLMTADILLFGADYVPVGSDQKQHLEITRDIANTFNKKYGEILKKPEPKILDSEPLLGIDGRKMSKSYNNTIPLFVEEEKIFKRFKKIKSDSTEIGQPISTEDDALYSIMKTLMNEEELSKLDDMYQKGLGRMDIKKYCFDFFINYFHNARSNFEYYNNNRQELHDLIAISTKEIQEESIKNLQEIKQAIGIINL